MEAREWQPQSIALSALAWRSVDGYNVRAELLPKRAKERIVLIEIQRSETRVLVKLVLRSRDDRPAIQQIWFSSPAGSYMLRVETKSIKVLQPFEIYSSLFEPEHPRAAWKSEDSPSASARTTGRAAHSRLSGPEQLEAEIQILYRLHQLKVCMGEAVELRRKPRLDELTISGRVVSAERRAQVISAVTPYLRPWIHLDLATNDELIARAAARVPHRQQLLSENTIISEGGVSRLSSPIRKAMERYLREDVKASSGSQDQEADRISLNILNHARLALKHAWALRHLSDRFPPASLQALPDSARSRLHELFSDHAEALGRELRLFRQLVIPIVGDRKAVQISPPGESNDVDSSDSRSRLLRAFFATEKLYGEVALLFARTSMGESDPGTAEPNIQQFITNLEQAETSSRLLAADLDDDEGTPTSLAQQRSQ